MNHQSVTLEMTVSFSSKDVKCENKSLTPEGRMSLWEPSHKDENDNRNRRKESNRIQALALRVWDVSGGVQVDGYFSPALTYIYCTSLLGL